MFHYVCAYVTYNKITNLRVSTHRHGHICDWNTTVTLAVEDDAAITSLFISFASKIHLQGSHVGMKLFICSGANLQTCMPNTRRRQDQIDVQCCALCSYRSTQDASAGIWHTRSAGLALLQLPKDERIIHCQHVMGPAVGGSASRSRVGWHHAPTLGHAPGCWSPPAFICKQPCN